MTSRMGWRRLAKDRRGVALMLVLWVVVVVGVVAAGVARASRSQMSLVATARSRSVARYAAESGVLVATSTLRESLRAATTPAEQVRAFRQFEEELASVGPRALGQGRYQVVAVDLSARVDLNNSSEEVISGLFQHVLGEREAARLVAALQDWTDEDDQALPEGAEREAYVRAGSPFRPTNRPMQRLDELTRVLGFTDSIADILAPYITVRGDGRLNVNSAPLPVLATAPELGQNGAEMLIASRDRGDLMASKVVVSSRLAEGGLQVGAQLSTLTTTPGHILIVSRGWEEGRPLTHEIQAVFQVHSLGLENGPGLTVRHWTERDL